MKMNMLLNLNMIRDVAMREYMDYIEKKKA